MSSEELRQAAALMRERAEAATPGPWESSQPVRNGYHPHEGRVRTSDGGYVDQDDEIAETLDLVDAEHIASWHPAVALAVADWLEWVAHCRAVIDGIAANVRARGREPQGPGKASQMFLDTEKSALAVARAYLGTTA